MLEIDYILVDRNVEVTSKMTKNENEVDNGRLFELFFDGESTAGSYVEVAIQLLIALNVFFMMFPSPGTFESSNQFLEFLCAIGERSQNFFLLLFAIEFALRCGTALKYKRDYFRTQWLWFGIDFIAVVPSVILYLVPSISFSFQIVRIFRIFRIFKIKILKDAGEVMTKVVRKSWDELAATMAIVVSMLFGSSILLTILESEHSKQAFNHSWAALWWAVATLTTVGYGDVVPESISGKIAGGFICLSGVLTFALPTAILGSSFVEVMSESKGKSKQAQLQCKHCGELIDQVPGEAK